MYIISPVSTAWLVWRNSNGVGHINKVTYVDPVSTGIGTYDGSTIPAIFIQAAQAHSAWPSHRGNDGGAMSIPVLVLATAAEETAMSAYDVALPGPKSVKAAEC